MNATTKSYDPVKYKIKLQRLDTGSSIKNVVE